MGKGTTTRRKLLIVATLVGVLVASAAGTIATRGPKEVLARGGRTLVYFTRHAEDATALVESEDGALLLDCVPFLDDGEPGECCRDILNELGELRASELAGWIRERIGSETITHVIASHKIRTLQTVRAIAADAALIGDDDLNPGDGVQQVPPFVGECDEGFESASTSRDPMIAEIAALPLGSVAVVGAHSGTLYPIMEAFLSAPGHYLRWFLSSRFAGLFAYPPRTRGRQCRGHVCAPRGVASGARKTRKVLRSFNVPSGRILI